MVCTHLHDPGHGFSGTALTLHQLAGVDNFIGPRHVWVSMGPVDCCSPIVSFHAGANLRNFLWQVLHKIERDLAFGTGHLRLVLLLKLLRHDSFDLGIAKVEKNNLPLVLPFLRPKAGIKVWSNNTEPQIWYREPKSAGLHGRG